MSSAASASGTSVSVTTAAGSEGFMDRHYGLLRRLHSLAGVIPIGLFLFFHLLTNSSILWGRLLWRPEFGGNAGVEAFQSEVDLIHRVTPALPVVEWFVLFIPIAFHALLGIYFARTGRSNAKAYPYQDNIRYSLQRITGYIGVLFIFLHVTSLHFGWSYGGLLPEFDQHFAASSTAIHFQDGGLGGIVIALFYFICVSSLVFHLSNGLWTAAITWGLTVSAQSMKRWGQICVLLGVLLECAAVASVIGFATLNIPSTQVTETRMLKNQLVDQTPPVAPDSPVTGGSPQPMDDGTGH